MKIKVGNGGGFGNRLYSWETMYEIAKINNAELECDFSELEHLILPNTIYNKEFNYSGAPDYNSNILGKTLDNGYVTTDSNNMIDFKLNPNFNYYPICGFGFNRHFNTIHINSGIYPKQQMKMKDSLLFDKIQDITTDCVGVHIRRGEAGHGKHDIFDPNRQGVAYYPVGTIPDFWYLSLMNQIKEIYPNIKFYISSNAKKEDLQVFYDNFNIITYRDILSTESEHNHMESVEEYQRCVNLKKSIDTDLSGIVDFYSLSCSNLLICSISTWSMCAYEMNNIPTIWPEARDQKLNSIYRFRNSIIRKQINIENIFKKQC